MAGRPPLLNEPFQPSLQFLTPEELYHTSDNVKSKVLRVLSDLSSNFYKSEAQRRNDKAAFDQQIFDLDSQLRERTAAVENSSTLLSNERKNSENYLDKYRTTLAQLSASDSKIADLEKELNGSKIQLGQATAEKEDLLSIVEKRNVEIDKLTNDIRNANDQLQSATVAKIEALAKVDELTSKEIELDYKEKQIEKEREWISKQVQLLNEELDKKNVEIIDMQREASLKYLGVQTYLAERTEELRIAELSLENVKKDNDEQEKQIARLLEKLKDSQTMEFKMEENFRQELRSQTKIAELYKDSSEEASTKVEELEDAVQNLQSLLKQATDRYGEIESRASITRTKLQDEISERDKTIEMLHKELSDANELLCNIKKQGMTDEMIQSLSPAAAAASAMLKSSHSLTEIFSRYQTVYTELVQTKGENEKLNGYVNQILQEITERAPTLRRQKEDYERCLKTIDALTTQLDLSLQEINDSKVENSHLKKTLGTVDRENNRLKVQLKDMALQIKSLVKEVELNRGNYSFADPDEGPPVVPDVESNNGSPRSSTRVITERLVTFRNIDELQAQNQHLLAVVRELSEAQEGSEKDLSQNKLKAVQDSLVAAKMELEDLKDLKIRQESMIESITQQRDMYASLIKQQHASPLGSPEKLTDSSAQEKIKSLERIIEENQAVTQKLKEEYDIYRKEKAENDKITGDQLGKLRDDLSRMRTENAKLASQTEYNNERAKIYTANLESYKKNIIVLEEKNKQHQLTVLRHEQTIETLKTELTTTQQKLARTDVNLSTTIQERNVLRDTKARLQAERDLFKREHSTQQMLHLNLQEIKNGLEMANSAARMKLENQVESLQQENTALRRKNDIETDRFKDTVLAWDKMTKDLQAKLDTQEKEMESLRNELSSSQGIVRTQRKEIEELLNKISVLTGSSSIGNANQSLNSSTTSSPIKQAPGGMTPERGQEESRENVLEKKSKDLTLQLIEAQTECKSLRQQMDFAKGSLEEYKMLAQAMEDQLNSANASSKNFSEELTERLACKDDIIRDIQARLDTIDKENAALKQEKEIFQREAEDKAQYMTEEINRMRRELQAANSKLQGLMEENCTVKADMERHLHVSKEIQEKYERELSLHAQDVRTGGEIKSELDELKGKVDEATRARLNIEETFNASKLSWEEKENNLNVQVDRMKKSLEELESLNTSLQDQLINLTTQMNSLRHTEGGENQPDSADTSLNVSFSENDARNSEQWLQLIRYLRREKEILRTKAEMAQTATSRLESQLAFMERQRDEVQKQLTEIQDKSHVSVITSAKQAELLRKVETLSALTDSNRMLREEKDSALKEIQELKTKLEQIETEISPLRVQNVEYETKCEALNSENISLKQDATRWRARASALLEKSNKVNPEEMKKLQVDKDNLERQLTTLQESYKKQQQEIARLTLQIKTVQQNLSTQQLTNAQLLSEKKAQLEESKKLSEQATKVKADVESLQSENNNLKMSQAEQGAEVAKLKKELDKTQKLLEEHRSTVKTIKNIAKKYKKQYEDLLEEHKTLQEVNKSLEDEASKVAAAAAAKVSVDGSTDTSEDPIPQDPSNSVEVLNQEISRQEVRVSEITSENEGLKRDMENVKSECTLREDRMKLAMKTLREKLTQSNQQRSEVEAELNEYKSKLSSAESSSEEVSVRFAALRSQLDGRILKLEKENKDLRAASGNSGESVVPGTSDMANVNANLQEENARLKKELDMLRTRTVALEKQFKMQSQQQVAKGSPSGSEKPQIEPPKANIKPIAGTSSSSSQKQGSQVVAPALSRPPLTASIRPMSMQRKATVMPTTAAAMPTQHSLTTQQQQQQQQQPPSSALPPVSPSMFVAPVSQAQVSTSTPDQSSAMEHTHHLPMTSSSTASVTNSTSSVRQATVQPTPAVTVVPIASTATIAAAIAPQGQSSLDRDSVETGVHEDPSTSTSTSHMDLEMGDSSEQVSSSESSTHQQMIPIAPIRSQQQDQVQQSSQAVVSGVSPANQSGSQSNVEEPSPSTSSTGTRPTQSTGKRGRESEVETSQESQRADEPESKRQRINIPMPIDREAEAMYQQEEFSVDEQSEDVEQEADQGRTDEENQVPHSDTSVAKIAASGIAPTDSQEDDDSDVIIIDSDEDEEEEPQRVRGTRGRDELDEGVEEEEEDLEEEGEDEEEIVDSDGEGGGDIESDDDDDEDDDGGGNAEGLEDDQEDQELEHDEGREAESMEDHEEDGEMKMVEEEGHEADTIEVIGDDDLNSQEEGQQEQEFQGATGLESSTGGSVIGTSAESREQGSTQGVPSSASGSANTTSFPSSSSAGAWGHTSLGVSTRPVPVSRPGRQERVPSLGRQHQLTPSSFQSGHGMYGDDIDDSIVPSTPTLFVPRRNDGFAEAVSSPQIPPQRFLFSSSDTITHSGASNSGLDDTRIDLYDDGSGRGSRQVPTTPLQVSPPPEAADLPSEMDSQGESALEVPTGGISHEMSDIQPSSSDSSRCPHPNTGTEIPAITITSALDSSLDSSPDQDRPLDDRELVHMMDPNLDNARVGVTDLSRPEASVTSSDEDKVDTGIGGQAHQSAASSSSRTASPTPSTVDQANSGQSQQHRVRPTPIVWDQPTSSSSSSAPPAPTRPIPRPARGRMLSRPLQQAPEAGGIAPLRGVFRQMRGAQPSARRSRPVTRSRGGTMRGSPFSKGPY